MHLKGDLGLGDAAAYTVRLLRTGYLYTLEDRSGVLTWSGYMVSARSHLIPFDTNVDAPLIDSIDTPLPCEECGNSPLDVTIENAQEVQKYYLLYARHPLHPSKLKEYERKRVEYAGHGMLQLIKPAEYVGNPGNLQRYMMSPDQLSDYVLDYLVFDDWKSGKDI